MDGRRKERREGCLQDKASTPSRGWDHASCQPRNPKRAHRAASRTENVGSHVASLDRFFFAGPPPSQSVHRSLHAHMSEMQSLHVFFGLVVASAASAVAPAKPGSFIWSAWLFSSTSCRRPPLFSRDGACLLPSNQKPVLHMDRYVRREGPDRSGLGQTYL